MNKTLYNATELRYNINMEDTQPKKREWRLRDEVLANSQAKVWDEAVREWDVVGEDEDADCETKCLCGKDGIRYCFVIRNHITGAELSPIGSKCIKKFGSQELEGSMKSIHKFRLFLDEYKTYYSSLGKDNKMDESSLRKFTRLFKDGDVLHHLHKNGFLDDRDFSFLYGIRRKRKLSIRQLNWRNDLVPQTIFRMNSDIMSKMALQQLTNVV